MDTRQKILDTALEMFSRRGFTAVSVRDISYAVGVKESALYKHFRNKQDVFDALIQNYMDMSRTRMEQAQVLYSDDSSHIEKEAALYMELGENEFVELGMSFFKGFLMTPYVMKFWRMISIEQYNNPKIAGLFNSALYEEPMVFQTLFFSRLIQEGALKEADPKQLAIEFYAPMLLLFLRMLPFHEDDKIIAETLVLFREHILHFRRTYGANQVLLRSPHKEFSE